MSSKFKEISRFLDEESQKALDEGLGEKAISIVLKRVLKRIKAELCDSNKDCLIELLDLWVASEEAKDSAKQ